MVFFMRQIMKCPRCGSYTMKEICPRCGVKTIIAKPPKYSPNDKYASYLRKAKENERKQKGLL